MSRTATAPPDNALPSREPKPSGFVLAVNQFACTLSILDPSVGTEIAVVPLGRVTGHEVVAAPDGLTAFVPVYGDSGAGKPGTDGREILVVDLYARRIGQVIDLGRGVRPHQPRYNTFDNLLYVTAELDRALYVINPRTATLVGAIPTGEPLSHMLAFSPDGRRGYTANLSSGTISVLDLVRRELVTVVPVAQSIQRIATSADGALIFTSDVHQPELDVIDALTLGVKARVALPAIGFGTAATPDGRWLLVAMPFAHEVAVVEIATLEVTRTIAVPAGPQELLVRPDGLVAYVSCMDSSTVAAIDLRSFSVTQQIAAGAGVDGLAWAHRPVAAAAMEGRE